MAIHKDELYEGGRVFLKTRFSHGPAQAVKTKPAIVVDILKGACRIRTEDGKERTVGFSELEADHEWLDERDRLEDEKRERIKREAMLPANVRHLLPPEPEHVRLVNPQPESKPLTATLGEFLQRAQKAEKAVEALQAPAKAPEPAEATVTPPDEKKPPEVNVEPAPALPEEEIRPPLSKGGRPSTTGTYLKLEHTSPADAPKPGKGPRYRQGFALRLRELLAWRGYRQTDISRMCNVSKSLPSLWATDRALPGKVYLTRLAEKLQVSEAVLTGHEPMPDTSNKRPMVEEQRSGRFFRAHDATPGLPNRIATLLKMRGVTAHRASEIAGFGSQSVSTWLGGTAVPDDTNLRKLGVFLGVSDEVLLGIEPMPRGLEKMNIPRPRTNAPGTGERFAKRLDELLRLRGKKAFHVAKETDIAKSTLSLWLSGVSNSLPTDRYLDKLANYFGVTVDVVIGEEPIPPGHGATPSEHPKPVAPEVPPPVAPVPPPAPPKPPAPLNEGAGWLRESMHEAREKSLAARDRKLLEKEAPTFDAWLEAGRKMTEPMRSELASLDAVIEPLEQRYLDLVARRTEVRNRLEALEGMLAKRGAK